MIASVLELLGLDSKAEAKPPGAETETVRRIVAALEGVEPERARFVAAFGYVLSRVARADLHVSDEETRTMERIVVERGEVPHEQAVLVVELAKHQNELFGGTENFLVTRELGRLATHGQKLAILRCLFAVAAAEGSIRSVEDRVIRQIADQLRLEHRDYIGVRGEFREQLAVLENRRPASNPAES